MSASPWISASPPMRTRPRARTHPASRPPEGATLPAGARIDAVLDALGDRIEVDLVADVADPLLATSAPVERPGLHDALTSTLHRLLTEGGTTWRDAGRGRRAFAWMPPAERGAGGRCRPARALALRTARMLGRRHPDALLLRSEVRIETANGGRRIAALPCELRRLPIRRSPRRGFGTIWEVRDPALATTVLEDGETFATVQNAALLRTLEEKSGHTFAYLRAFAHASVLLMHGPRHVAAREVLLASLGGANLVGWHASIDARIERTLDALEGRDRFDLAADYVRPIALGTMTDLLGVRGVDEDELARHGPAIQELLEGMLPLRELIRLEATIERLHRLLTEASARHDGSAAPDRPLGLLERTAREPVEGFDRSEMVFLALNMLAAGSPLEGMMSNVLHWIVSRPDLHRAAASDAQWVGRHLGMLTTANATAKQTFRRTSRRTTLGGETLAAGQTVRVRLASADAGRTKGRMSFGWGAHRCVGIALTRHLVQRAVPALLQRVPDLALEPLAHTFDPHFNTMSVSALPAYRDVRRPRGPAEPTTGLVP